MTRAKRITAALMVVLLLTTFFCTIAQAATSGYASSGKTYTMTVKTGKSLFPVPNFRIYFQKGAGMGKNGKEVVTRGFWRVKVLDSKGRVVANKSNYNGAAVHITGLKRNATYTVKIYMDRGWTTQVKGWWQEPKWNMFMPKNIVSYR